jgi:hypothetical protein
VKAAVIHDYWCKIKSRSWENVHRIFYEAMLTDGVPEAQAKAMYLAVYYRGPRWHPWEMEEFKNYCEGNWKSIEEVKDGALFASRLSVQSACGGPPCPQLSACKMRPFNFIDILLSPEIREIQSQSLPVMNTLKPRDLIRAPIAAQLEGYFTSRTAAESVANLSLDQLENLAERARAQLRATRRRRE